MLSKITQLDEMLISQAFPVIQIHMKPNGGQRGYKGHGITLLNDVQKLADILPKHSKDIPVIVFKINDNYNKSRELKIRRKNIEEALTWLTGSDENGEPNNFLLQRCNYRS